MPYEAVIGLEVHAELQTRAKMFCACAVVDSVSAPPNTSVCAVCAGMPGMLPVTNAQAIEYALRVALALECEIQPTSLFARKNYFYPDLPKGYQISQYEYPLARNGRLTFDTPGGARTVRIRRVHLEEDTGKLTHVTRNGQSYTLVDLNRAGVPLLEIVTEPDLHTPAETRAYAETLRAILRCLEVNSGDLEKGVLRIEPNVSVRPVGRQQLGTRTEIKNLNSFRTLERAVAFEIERQSALLDAGGSVVQQTVGWDESAQSTFAQRGKEEAHDYRYFPEPDLPPLLVDSGWVAQVKANLPELPGARTARLQDQYGLTPYQAGLLLEDCAVADYFETAVDAARSVPPRSTAAWISGDLFAWMNASGQGIATLRVTPAMLAELLTLTHSGAITQANAREVLAEMLASGAPASEVVARRDLRQVSGAEQIAALVRAVLAENPRELAAYQAGKRTLVNWFFGQAMQRAGGQANPAVLRAELDRQLQVSTGEQE